MLKSEGAFLREKEVADLNFAGITDKIGWIEEKSQDLVDAMNPFSAAEKLKGKIPFWSTGARSFIRIGGRPVGVCTDFRWQITYTATPIHTIDTPHAWDIDVGQCAIVGTLNNILDPTKGPESTGLFHTMQSAVHQPLVEMQVLDATGTSIFFARGMFNQVNGSIARGQVSTISASFQGIAYQHYVTQTFKPYESIAGAGSALIDGLQGLVSNATGGLL